jgi:hypothetical protein
LLIGAAFDAWLKKPLRSVFEGLEKGFKLCIESGDLVYGTGCAYHLLTSQWCSGLSLPKILSSIGACASAMPRSQSCG